MPGIKGFFGAGGVSFKAEEIPSLRGKVFLVTGGNTGLGKATILELAKHEPAEIWLAGRNTEKGQKVLDEVKDAVPTAIIKLLELDLTSFESIRNAAKTFTSQSKRLDVLILNAGIMAVPPGQTKEGYEIQFGTNHIGHFLFTKLLLPTLEATVETQKAAKQPVDVRVVVLTSTGMYGCPKQGIDYSTLKTDAAKMNTWTRYGQSKLANALFARELAKRYPDMTASAIHPGAIATDLARDVGGRNSIWVYARDFLMKTIFPAPKDGAKGQLWAATVARRLGDDEEDKDGVKSGECYFPVGVPGMASALSKEEGKARELWEWTEGEIKGHVA